MKSVAVDWQNPMFSPGTPSFFKILIIVLLLLVILFCLRMLRYCLDESNGTEYICKCGATLITSRHALCAFHCVNIDCELQDFSKGDGDILVILLFSGQHISILQTFRFSMHLLEDRFVVAGENEVAPYGQKESLNLTYIIEGLLFKTTVVPAVFSRCSDPRQSWLEGKLLKCINTSRLCHVCFEGKGE